MEEINKCVYIFVTDKPLSREQVLFRTCRQNHILAVRSCLNKEEILRLVQSLNPEAFQNNHYEKKSTGEHYEA